MNNRDRLNNLIRHAVDDDHLEQEERIEIINLHRELNPDFVSSGDIDRDFVDIIF